MQIPVMPRGRLTPEDRQRLAAGLAEGLRFAEIARRLERPTSTVTREVARNGGREVYRWDAAQQATRRRARRHTPARPRDVPAAVDRHGRDSEALRGFVERFATVLARTGLPKMTARVLIALFTSDSRSLTAAELVLRLRVSPASISKAIGHLEELELVRREHDEHQRRERYIVDEDAWPRAWGASARKQESLAEIAREGVKVLGARTPAGSRMRDMQRFFAQLSGEMVGVTNGPRRAIENFATAVAAVIYADSTAIRRTASGYALTIRLDRLSTAQRRAIEAQIRPG
jgi:DNA-binding transcriptional regulator GbsR (MarR family)